MNAATAAANQGNNNAAPSPRKNHFKAANGFKNAGASMAVNTTATSANEPPQQSMKSAAKSYTSMAPFRLPKSKKNKSIWLWT